MPRYKLQPHQVRQIREHLKRNAVSKKPVSQDSIARLFFISPQQLSGIKNRSTWSNLSDQDEEEEYD